MQGPVGSTGGQGDRGLKGSVGAKGDRGKRGECGLKGEKCIQGVLAYHLPIQLATQYGEKCALSRSMYQRIGRVS